MIHLTNFCNNGYLFKCHPLDFNVTIQNVFTDIFTTSFGSYEYCKLLKMFNNGNIGRCVICLKSIDTIKYTVCRWCVKICVGYNIDLRLGITYRSIEDYTYCLSFCSCELFNDIFSISSDQIICRLGTFNNDNYNVLPSRQQLTYQNITFYFVKRSDKYALSDASIHNFENEFTKNLPKLHDRVYHVTLITFILALNDVESPIHVLINDVMIHIILIYLSIY